MLQQYFSITVSGPRSKKKTRTRIQVKDIKLRLFKNLFLKLKSKHLCCSLQNKHFEQKSIIFSDISLTRLSKYMSIAMQNMTESKKKSVDYVQA